jgi:hypothetical protein
MRPHNMLILAAVAAALLLPTLAFGQVVLGGYVQQRFTDVFGAADTNKVSGFAPQPTFTIRRARLSAKATLDAKTTAVIEVDASKSLVELKKAYVAYSLSPVLYTNVGRTNLPFGYENPMSSSAITPLDRSMISTNGMPEYATGLFLIPTQEKLAKQNIKTTLSIVNGDDPSAVVKVDGSSGSNNPYDNPNNNLVTALTVEHRLKSGNALIGVSGATDTNTHGAFDAYASTLKGKAKVTTEYMVSGFDSKLKPHLSGSTTVTDTGYYVLGSLQVRPTDTVYARYDAFETDEAGYQQKTRWTAGFLRNLSPSTKFTAEYQAINDPANTSLDGAFGAQLQVKF